jgi:hypothetical protein
VIHFVARLKPWDGVYTPWSNAEFQPYVEMAAGLRGADVVWRRKPLAERIAYRFKPLFQKDLFADRAYRKRIDDMIRERSPC